MDNTDDADWGAVAEAILKNSLTEDNEGNEGSYSSKRLNPLLPSLPFVSLPLFFRQQHRALWKS